MSSYGYMFEVKHIGKEIGNKKHVELKCSHFFRLYVNLQIIMGDLYRTIEIH